MPRASRRCDRIWARLNGFRSCRLDVGANRGSTTRLRPYCQAATNTLTPPCAVLWSRIRPAARLTNGVNSAGGYSSFVAWIRRQTSMKPTDRWDTECRAVLQRLLSAVWRWQFCLYAAYSQRIRRAQNCRIIEYAMLKSGRKPGPLLCFKERQ